MEANPDFKELLRCLNDARVRYLLVGARAVAYHSEPRYTKAIDLWVEPTCLTATTTREAQTEEAVVDSWGYFYDRSFDG